jgi:uncharacterized protein involved in response to NO
MAVIPRLKDYRGPALFSYGFRPFFLAGAAFAGLGILLWLPLYFGDLQIPTAFSPLDWHVHEMLYGYLPAVITGFLLTAIPNWTGRLPLQGGPLAVLAAVWLAGRIAVFCSALIGPALAGAIDVLFLVLVAAAAAREVITGRNWRNLGPVGILCLFIAGNVAFHIEAFTSTGPQFGKRIGIAAAIALIMLIGGRVIPSFTRNWLARENPGRLPAPFGRFDIAAAAISLPALGLWIARPEWRLTAAVMLLAGLMQIARLVRWAGDRTVRDRLVLVLHVGYAFVPLGFLLMAGAILMPGSFPRSAGIHAWTVGAIGMMTLAIMTRASLGHTGQQLLAGPVTQMIYVAAFVAAALRIWAAFDPSAAMVLLQAAGAAWLVGFWGFAFGYGPALLRPRRRSHRPA